MDHDIIKEWYGERAEIIEENDDYMVVDYGVKGHGTISVYNIFDGIKLCFMNLDTTDVIPSQKFNKNSMKITFCREGRYECEFSDGTISYLPEGYFGVAGTNYLPEAISFPLKKCFAISIIIDKTALSDELKKALSMIPLDFDEIGENLGVDKIWYVRKITPKLDHLFSELYEGRMREGAAYFKIKVMELLYYINRLTKLVENDRKYFNRQQIEATKDIKDYLIAHYNEKTPIEPLLSERNITLSAFHEVFTHIYGDTPYAYVKKYKMKMAAEFLMNTQRKIGDIAKELGYSNASKFSKAFQSVYGDLPKDYRKANAKVRLN